MNKDFKHSFYLKNKENKFVLSVEQILQLRKGFFGI